MILQQCYFKFALISLCLCSAFQLHAQPQLTQAKIALVIDDMGHNVALNRAVLRLPGDISYAFLPYARYSKRMAVAAQALGRDILLHAPMENLAKLALGPGGLTTAQTRQEFETILRRNIAAIPYLKGVNNHTGSKLTAMTEQMQWTMDILAEQRLYFLDSRTSAKSVAWREAKRAGVPALSRDVFLDHSAAPKDMEREFQRALNIAKKHGQAILIGHPRTATVNFLQQNIKRLAQQNIQLVSLSSLLIARAAPFITPAVEEEVVVRQESKVMATEQPVNP